MDGISGASAVFSLVELAGKTVSYIKQVKNAPQEKQQLLSLLIQSKGLLLTLGELIESIEDESWASTIHNLATTDGPFAQYQVILKQIASKLDIRGDGSRVQRIMDRLKWPFSHKEAEEMMTTLEKLKSMFLLATANSHVRLSMETRNKVEKTNYTLHDIKAVLTTHLMSLTPRQKTMVESLSSIDLSNRLDQSKIILLTNTCGWFLEHKSFRSWEKGKASFNALAVVSGPGTGKSTLCEVVQYYLQLWLDEKPDCSVVYLPLRLQVRLQMNKASMLSKIISQILLACPHLITHLLALRRPHGVLPFDVGIKLLQTARADLEQLYIIIDGLDEADDEEICALLDGLLEIQPPLNLLVATRPVQYLEDRITCHIYPQAADGHQDLLNIIKLEIEATPSLMQFLGGSDEKMTEAANIIAASSRDLLINFAKLHIQWLATAENSAIFHRMLHRKIDSLRELYTIEFDDVLQQIPERKCLAEALFAKIIKHNGVLTLDELREALSDEITTVVDSQGQSRDPSDGELIEIAKSCCKSFVRVSQHESQMHRISFTHASIPEYLTAAGHVPF